MTHYKYVGAQNVYQEAEFLKGVLRTSINQNENVDSPMKKKNISFLSIYFASIPLKDLIE